ncbi:helix-turn-helix transcriptional regulator [Oceanospirillaceae bacterium]|nr:helix-turn-helix transcriptional regulator [Oceanospirillaceae bacterium]|tara:strand:+ start:3555 stop:4070 length:516 start_codon:yes stop_codon:yes gene_type:complete
MIYSKTKYQLHYLVLNLLVIGACEIFFLADVIFDVFNYDLIKLHWVSHTQVEVVFTLCLGITLFFFVHNIRSLLKRQKKAETTVKVASGELSLVIQRYFEIWRLTPSETEVALLLFKGFSAQEIADLRSTKIGTVKNQSSVVYQKANVKNRNELFAIFVEDLLGDLGSSST